jgi:photosystem II stability/assembly factor-like uncharacterized protein
MRGARLLRRACLTAAVAALAGCGGSSHTTGGTTLPVNAKSTPLVNGSRPPFITGLAVNPKDQSILLATNEGLYEISADGHSLKTVAAQAHAGGHVGPYGKRVSSLGFLNPGELLGSGHPNGTAGSLPPFLGVIKSSDGGHTWTAIARVGYSDLHVLVISGSTVYGFDTLLGGVVASYNDGQSFEERTSPPGEYVHDLAIDPNANHHLLASTLTGIFSSADGGNSWQQISHGAAPYLAWNQHGLFRVDADRSVLSSSDGGVRWTRVGELPRTPGKLVETADGTLYAALTEGSIVTSSDGGRSWKILFAP